MRQVGGKLRLHLAQYRALCGLRSVRLWIDKATEGQSLAAPALSKSLKQGQYSPWPVEEQVVILWTAGQGYLDDIEDGHIARFQTEFAKYVRFVGAPILFKAFAPRKPSTMISPTAALRR